MQMPKCSLQIYKNEAAPLIKEAPLDLINNSTRLIQISFHSLKLYLTYKKQECVAIFRKVQPVYRPGHRPEGSRLP